MSCPRLEVSSPVLELGGILRYPLKFFELCEVALWRGKTKMLDFHWDKLILVFLLVFLHLVSLLCALESGAEFYDVLLLSFGNI